MGDCGAGEARPSLRRCDFHHDRLVDNYVNNPSAPDLITRSRQEAASSKLAASARWALLVRCRVAADAVGVMLMLSGRAALGAAFLLAAHSAFWYGGAAASPGCHDCARMHTPAGDPICTHTHSCSGCRCLSSSLRQKA